MSLVANYIADSSSGSHPEVSSWRVGQSVTADDKAYQSDDLWCAHMQEQLKELGRKVNDGDPEAESGASSILSQLEEKHTCAPSDCALKRLVDAILEIGNGIYSQFENNGELKLLDLVIRCEVQAARLTPEDDPALGDRFYNLSISYRDRYNHLYNVGDIDKAIECLVRAKSLTFQGHGENYIHLQNLGIAHLARFEHLGELKDVDKAIDSLTRAVSLIPAGHEFMLASLSNLGISYRSRFERLGNLDDIDEAIKYTARVVLLTPESHRNMPGYLTNLGASLHSRYEHLGQLEDLDNAIKHKARAVLLTPEGHTKKPMRLNNLGASHLRRFECFGQLEDIQKAFECNSQAVSLTPQGNTPMSGRLSNLGNTYQVRFQYLGKMEDLDKAIEYIARAVSLTAYDHVDMPSRLNNLGNAHRHRFERLGHLEDIRMAIEYIAQAVSLTPEGHTNMPIWLGNLGIAHQIRFEHLGKLEDIDKAIELKTRAVSLTPEDHADMPQWLNNLGISHQSRFERLGELGDIKKAIECSSRAMSLTPESHAAFLGRLGNVGILHHTRFERLGRLEDIDKAIQCASRVVSLAAESHPNMSKSLSNLGISHLRRYERLGKLEDIDKAIECFGRAVTLAPEDHADLPSWLSHLGLAHQCRFERLREQEDIDKAITSITRAVSLTSADHASLPMLLGNLGISHHSRFEHLGQLDDIDKAIKCQTRALSLAPEGHANMSNWLSNLGSSYLTQFDRLERLGDIEMAIECNVRALSLTPAGHADIPVWLNHLGNAHRIRFEHLGNLEDIEKSIEYVERAVSLTPEGHVNLSNQLNCLGISHYSRFKHFGDPQSLIRSLECFRNSALFQAGNPHLRFFAACRWAEITMLDATLEHLTAFQTAMNLVPHIVWLGSTIRQRYSKIPKIGDIATQAAAAAIRAQKYELALEWLEQGRSIVWHQKLQLRNPFEDLFAVNPLLADNLRQVSHALHNAGSRSRNLISPANDITVDSPEQAAQRHRRLAEKYDELVNEVRDIPGFESFLRPKMAWELVRAARTGPIVVINVHTVGCDALILLPNQTKITHVPLPNLSPARVNEALSQLECSLRRHDLRERHVLTTKFKHREENGLVVVLATLWTDIVKPVLDSLMCMNEPEAQDLPHITWCSTGPLSFLPLHAAGCFNERGVRVFDLAISSYTPTLSALLSAPSFSGNHSRVLAVGQEATPGHNPLPGTKAELAYIKEHALAPLCYTQLDGPNATTGTVLLDMEKHDWVHLACHAHQNLKDPVESGFFLHDGTLSLASITQKLFKNKGLAFLSACQTAQGDKTLPDEAVHLASGMLMAGYPSVIATMWSVKDADAPVIADKVYGELFKDGRMDYQDAAKALHVAVNQLRAKIGENAFERWASFIHVGV